MQGSHPGVPESRRQEPYRENLRITGYPFTIAPRKGCRRSPDNQASVKCLTRTCVHYCDFDTLLTVTMKANENTSAWRL